MRDAQTTKILLDLDKMMKTPGWTYLKNHFAKIASDLQMDINEPGGNELKYSEGDLKKIELRILLNILNYPNVIFDLSKSRQPFNQLDPFKEESEFEEEEEDLE